MGKVIGTMVVCLACKTVVWAHDSDWGDVRGALNVMQMPCRLCGDVREWKGYDSWDITTALVEGIENLHYSMKGDVWAVMRHIAEQNGFAWDNSPDMRWFQGTPELLSGYSADLLEIAQGDPRNLGAALLAHIDGRRGKLTFTPDAQR